MGKGFRDKRWHIIVGILLFIALTGQATGVIRPGRSAVSENNSIHWNASLLTADNATITDWIIANIFNGTSEFLTDGIRIRNSVTGYSDIDGIYIYMTGENMEYRLYEDAEQRWFVNNHQIMTLTDDQLYITKNLSVVDTIIATTWLSDGNMVNILDNVTINQDVGDAGLFIDSELNRDSCIYLTEGDGAFGTRLCNDGSGVNRFVIANERTGFEYIVIDRDSGEITFNNDTIFNENITVHIAYINVTNATFTGDITANSFNGSWNGSVDYVPYTGATQNVDLGGYNISSNHTLIGNEEGDHCIYFYEAGSPVGARICWDDSSDYFYFDDTIQVSGGVAGGTIAASTVLYSHGDLYTTGAGDDLWLGSITQGLANFRAYANGDLFMSGNHTGFDWAIGNVGNFSTIYENGENISDKYVPYTGATKNVDLGANNFTVDTNVLYVDKDNNRVGIGTSTPTQELEVYGNAKVNKLYFPENAVPGTAYVWLQERPSVTARRIMMYGLAQSNDFGFVISPTDTTSKNVGFEIWDRDIDNPAVTQLVAMSTSVRSTNDGKITLVSYGAASVGDFILSLGPSTSLVEFLRAKSTGRIGFGHTNPTIGTLQIGRDGESWGLTFYNDTGSSFRIYRLNDVGYINRGADFTKGISIDNAGNVGISTNDPNATLHVLGGDIKLEGGDVNISEGGGTADHNFTAENIWLPTYCFAHTNDAQNITGSGVWLNISFDEQVSLCTHMTHTHSDSTNDTFTIQDDGVYDISYHLTFSDTAPAPDGHVEMRITRNATEIPGSALEEDSSKQYNDFTLSNGVIVVLTEDDEIRFQFTADDDTIGMSAHAAYASHKDTGVIKIRRIG